MAGRIGHAARPLMRSILPVTARGRSARGIGGYLEQHQPALLPTIPARAWRGKWVVDVQPVGRGQTALRYLAAYVQKTALSARRLVACDDTSITFTHQDRATGQTRTVRLSGEEFLRRFLQHVLPKGFQRVRHFGWF